MGMGTVVSESFSPHCHHYLKSELVGKRKGLLYMDLSEDDSIFIVWGHGFPSINVCPTLLLIYTNTRSDEPKMILSLNSRVAYVASTG